MDELIVVPDAVPNCEEIIELAERHRRLFEDYPSAAALELGRSGPVRAAVRYTLVTIPARPPRKRS